MKAFLETFRPVSGYEGLYEVSDYGVVRSLNYLRTGKRSELKPGKNNKGYQIVSLYREGVGKTYTACCRGKQNSAGGYRWQYANNNK